MLRSSSSTPFLPPLIIALLAGLLLLAPGEAAAQCSMCKRALEASGQGDLLDGFKWSIAFMVIPPTLMTAGLGLLVFRSGRSSRLDDASRAAASDAHANEHEHTDPFALPDADPARDDH